MYTFLWHYYAKSDQTVNKSHHQLMSNNVLNKHNMDMYSSYVSDMAQLYEWMMTAEYNTMDTWTANTHAVKHNSQRFNKWLKNNMSTTLQALFSK